MSTLESGGVEKELKLEKNAGLIMGTNNSSIVSKRSVERLYLPEPHFFRYFVRKPQRRSPTINRGYWLRIRAVDHAVRQFLEKPSDKAKVVINLGCGYDPLPFLCLARDGEVCMRTKFVDVDYEELLISKKEIILSTPKLKSLMRQEISSDSKDVVLDSHQYAAVGCDLRNIKRLNDLVKYVAPSIEESLVLCVSEVSIAYMHPDAADAVIAWAASVSPDTTFCLLEQSYPDRPDHPFTATMMKHFEKLGTPLRTVVKYPGIHDQTQRFFAAGFQNVDARNLWELWADPAFLSPSQRMALDRVEPFDEWEEFALFASHYLLVIANTGEALASRPRRESESSLSSEMSTRTASPIRHGSQIFALQFFPNPPGKGKEHHGKAYHVPRQDDVIAVHGGIGLQTRMATIAVYAPVTTTISQPILSTEAIPARSCHSMTAFGECRFLAGGRASPAAPMKDCWVLNDTAWIRVHDLPTPLYRHSSVEVTLPGDISGVLTFGGKTGPNFVATETLLWDPRQGWQKLRSLKQDPTPRFGAQLIPLGYNHGILCGGMRVDGVMCHDFWRWRLVIRDHVVAGIAFTTSHALDASAGAYPWFARFGSSYTVIRDKVIIVGGIGQLGCIPKNYELLYITGSFDSVGDNEAETPLRLGCIDPTLSSDQPRPLLVGHSTMRTRRKDETLILGGGATCFSFGTYWNEGCFLLHDREAGIRKDWGLLDAKHTAAAPPHPESHSPISSRTSIGVHGSSPSPPDIVERILLSAANDFTSMVYASDPQPKILTSLSTGPSSHLWTPAYLKSRIPSSHTVVVHSASSRSMSFQRKDFEYRTLAFPDFIDALEKPDTHMYLRSLSRTSPATTPANLATDFPEIAADFVIPQLLQQACVNEATLHSSPLRVSANVNMWLHYDTMANVLFQIHGDKQLLLFPPRDIARLAFPPGSTTSILGDLFATPTAPTAAAAAAPYTIPPNTHPHLAVLRAGDALFIPPLWAHAGAPLPASSPSHSADASSTSSAINIAVNTFFRSLPARAYAAGRDVYGNRDLAAYEDGRRDVDRIARRFARSDKRNSNGGGRGNGSGDDDATTAAAAASGPAAAAAEVVVVPKEIRRAYLERLGQELLLRARQL